VHHGATTREGRGQLARLADPEAVGALADEVEIPRAEDLGHSPEGLGGAERRVHVEVAAQLLHQRATLTATDEEGAGVGAGQGADQGRELVAAAVVPGVQSQGGVAEAPFGAESAPVRGAPGLAGHPIGDD